MKRRITAWMTAAWLVVTTAASAQVVASTNQLSNPSFEEPPPAEGAMVAGWDYYSTRTKGGGMVSGVGRTGQQCVNLEAQGVPNGGQGFVQRASVVPGGTCTFCAYVKDSNDSPLGGSASVQLVIEWLNEAGREVARVSSPPGAEVSRLRWNQMCLSRVTVPNDAVRAVFGIHLYEGAEGGKGALFVDDMTLTCDSTAQSSYRPATAGPTGLTRRGTFRPPSTWRQRHP
ncbi:MAG: hypothetical protein V1873_07830 [Verrucomicrobiota bacterium]